MPKETVLEKYRGKKGEEYHTKKHGVPENRYMWVARELARKTQPYVSRDDVVLDYGTGTGRNLAALVCREKIGYDIADSVRAIVDRHGIRFVDDLSLIDDCSIDVTICHHVLEHVPNPYETLEEISRKIRPAGKLLVFVPYEFERLYRNFNRNFNRNDTNMHLYSWNVQTLGALVESAGFEVKETRLAPYGCETFAARHAPLGEQSYRSLLGFLRILRPVLPLSSLEIRLIARKPQSSKKVFRARESEEIKNYSVPAHLQTRSGVC